MAAPVLAVVVVDDPWRDARMAVELDPLQAAGVAASALQAARQAGAPGAELSSIIALMLSYDAMDQLDRHADGVDRGSSLADAAGDAEAKSLFGEFRARAMAESGRQEQALHAFQSLVDDAVRQRLARLPWLLLAQGEALGNVGRRYEAFRAQSRAYDLFEARGDRLGMANALTGIAGSHADMSDANSQKVAQDYVTRALGLIDPGIHRRTAVMLNVRLGVTLQRQHLAAAGPQLERGRDMADQLHLPWWAAEAHYFLAKLALDDKRHAEALRQLDLALPEFRGGRDKSYTVAAVAMRGEALAALGRRSESLATLTEGERLLPESHNPRLEAFFRFAASQVYAQLGDDHQAYEQLLALRSIERRLADDTNAQETEELKVRFGVELQQRENALLRAEQEQAQARRMALLVTLALTIATLGALVLYLRKRAAMARGDAAHQAALARAQAEASRAKSAFLASMSHELRTPLNAILGYAQLLSWDPQLGGKARDGLKIIEHSGRHLLSLIDDSLNLARIEAGRLELTQATMLVGPFLQSVADLIRVRALQKRIGFELVVQDCPQAVLADERQLRQVLLNLLGNAVKFTDHGQVELIVTGRHAPGAARAHLRFRVRDSGVGIAPADLPLLFQPFQQVGDAERRSGGTGLGLAISQQIVGLMGGRIDVSSESGRGSEFSFEIELPVAAAPLDSRGGDDQPVIGYEGPRRRLLVVDDHESNRSLLSDALRPLGFEVEEARNGEEGIARAMAVRPDLIIVDNAMPKLGGLEAVRKLRQMPGYAELPVIVVSASVAESASGLDKSIAVAAYLLKPVELRSLLAVLGAQLGLNYRRA